VEKVAAVIEITESGGGGSCAKVVGEDVRVVRIVLLDLIYLAHISYYILKAYRINLQVSPASSS
jgi:hypothetical protein